MSFGISWPLASMIVICAALTGATVWYERSRPSSRVVAMIAALAALAIAGRVIAPVIPNVQATSDVTLLSGYVLGPGPGFAIGAIAALGSNMFLGQGPWTPWEMLGWGMLGVGGALLARVTGRRLGRLSLALVCAAAGFVYGAWMDLSVMMNFSGQQSGDSYLVIAASSLPFNLAHASGNFALAFAFGPGFVRLLERFRARLDVTWSAPRGARPRAATITTISSLVVLALLLGAPAGAATNSKTEAVRYLRGVQNGDGGFAGGPGQSSSQLMTGWAVLGLEAAGRNPRDLKKNGRTPIDFMRAGAGQLDDAAELSRTVLALDAAGVSVRSFAGRDLLAELERRQRGDGSFQGQAPTTAFAIMALGAAGRTSSSGSVRRATAWLSAQQNSDGGFSNGAKGGASDVDDTGAALQGMAAGAGSGPRIRRAIRFIARAQNSDGGVGQFPGGKSNAQSAAWAAQGLVAVGRRPSRMVRGGRSLQGYLSSLQQSDGSFRYSRTSTQTPVWVTAQVLAAISRVAFPLNEVPRRTAVRATAASASRPSDQSGDGKRSEKQPARGQAAHPGTASAVPAAREQAEALAPASATGTAQSAEVKESSGAAPDRWRFGLAGLAVVAALGAGWWLRRRRGADA